MFEFRCIITSPNVADVYLVPQFLRESLDTLVSRLRIDAAPAGLRGVGRT